MLKRYKIVFLSFFLLISLLMSNPIEAIAYCEVHPNTYQTNIPTHSFNAITVEASESVRYLKLRVLLGDTYRENYSDAQT